MKSFCSNAHVRVFQLALSLLLLVGCQSGVPTRPTIDDLSSEIASREAALSSLDGFTVNGGLGVWTDDESISAKIVWRQASDTVLMTLVAPLGLGTLELHRDSTGATLTRGNSVIGRGPSADQVLSRGLRLERPIPLEQMSAWLRGLPGDGRKIQRDAFGRIETLQYRDSEGLTWQARFLKYSKIDNLDMPALISANGGPYNVRLKLRDWELASAIGIDVPGNKSPDTGKSSRRLAIPGQ